MFGSAIPYLVSDPAGKAFPLYFMKVPEPKVGKNRFHLDLVTDGPMSEKVERLVQLGARLVDLTFIKLVRTSSVDFRRSHGGSRVLPNMFREGALRGTCDDSKYVAQQHIWKTANCWIGVGVAHRDGGSGRFESPWCAYRPAASAQNRRRMRVNTQVTGLSDRRIRCGDKSQVRRSSGSCNWALGLSMFVRMIPRPTTTPTRGQC
jgi:hypothetical protein